MTVTHRGFDDKDGGEFQAGEAATRAARLVQEGAGTLAMGCPGDAIPKTRRALNGSNMIAEECENEAPLRYPATPNQRSPQHSQRGAGATRRVALPGELAIRRSGAGTRRRLAPTIRQARSARRLRGALAHGYTMWGVLRVRRRSFRKPAAD